MINSPFWNSEGKQRIAALVIGSIAAGVAFGWIAGVAVFFITVAVMPNIHS